MKQAFLALLILLASILPAQARVTGGSEINSKTNLIGANVSGMELNHSVVPGTQGFDYADVTVKELTDLRNHDIINLRLPFASDRMQQSYLGSFDATYTAQMDTIVSRAAALGMKIVWDNHQFGSMLGHTLNDGTLTTADVADFCTKYATHFYGNKTVIGFEIQNEPNSFGYSNWFSYAQTCITAFRAVDPNTPILVDGYGYASEYQWLANGNDTLKTLTGGNLVMVGHAYADYNNSGTYPVYGSSLCCAASPDNSVCAPGASTYSCAHAMGDQLDSPPTTLDTNILTKRSGTYFIPWCNINGPLYHFTCVTNEEGVPNDDPNWLTALDKNIALHQANNIPFFYWSAGEFFNHYSLGIQNQASGIDNPQWAVLNKYTNTYPASTYQFTGPTRGTASVASTNFTATYTGNLMQQMKVTPTSNGGGGTFTPPSITFQPGFNPSGNFTFTSSNAAIFKLSTSNNLVKTDPPAFGFASLSDLFLQTGASTVNCYSMEKIYGPYLGPLYQLRDTTTLATRDVYPLNSLALNSPPDVAGTTAWLNGHSAAYTTVYDQCPLQQHLYSLYDNDVTQDGGSTTTADEPAYIASCQNGLPCMDFSGGGRMAAKSPVNNNTAQTVLGVFAPAARDGTFIGWDWSGTVNQDPYDNDFVVYPSVNMRAYSTASVFSAMGVTWQQNTANTGANVFRDGQITDRSGSGSAALSLPFSRNNLNIGYQRFISNDFGGKISEALVFNNALSAANIAIFQTGTGGQDSRWGISAFPSMVMYSSTLQQNKSSGNAPYWAGVNYIGAAAGGGFSNISCSPGVNNSGKCPWNKTFSAGAGAYFASRGINLVRFAVSWPSLQQNLCTGDTTLDATQLANMDAYINDFTSHGIDVMIDLHTYGSYNYNTWYNSTTTPTTCTGAPDDGNIVNTQTGLYFVNFWTQMGARYASNPKVYFDLTNEPDGQAAATQAPVFQSAINGARGAGFNNYIFVEFGSSFAKCEDVATGAGAAFIGLTDAQNKLVLECHRYLQSCNNDQCGEGASNGAGISDLTGATTYCAANGCHLFWGEYNATFDPTMYTELKAAYDLMAANPTVWYGDAEYAAGPAWTETYIGKVQPSGFALPYVDRPQMRLLNAHATGHSWLCKGGGTGTAGVCPGTWPDGQFP